MEDGFESCVSRSIASAREYAGLSREELSEISLVPAPTIKCIESGNILDNMFETIAIAHILHIPLKPIAKAAEGAKGKMFRESFDKVIALYASLETIQFGDDNGILH